MSKSRISITIDERVFNAAKDKGVNISAECERTLKHQLFAKKADAPEESIYLKCATCGHLFNDGYLCELTGRCICQYCNPKDKCVQKDHCHIRVPGLDNGNLNILKKFVVDGSIDKIDTEIVEINPKKGPDEAIPAKYM
jgi:hypothetical protein